MLSSDWWQRVMPPNDVLLKRTGLQGQLTRHLEDECRPATPSCWPAGRRGLPCPLTLVRATTIGVKIVGAMMGICS